MDITLSEHHATLAKKRAAAAGYDDVGEYIVHLLEADEEEPEETQEEFLASLRQGLDDIAAGRGRPIREAMADIARRHGLKLPE